MKKNRLFILIVLVFCMLVFSTSLVNAASLNLHAVSKTSILGVNTFRMNDYDQIKYVGVAASAYAKEINSSFQGAAPTPYHLFEVSHKNAYISVIYKDVGWFNDGNGERAINAVMTLSNFNNLAGDVTTGSGTHGGNIGFNYRGLTWILLENGMGGLNADVEIFFYYADDSTRQPIDMKSAYIGVGGYNSEKRTWNTGTSHDQAPGIAGRQWEWISFDSQPVSSIDVYYLSEESRVYPGTSDQRRYISVIGAQDSFYSWDADGEPFSYGWGTGEPFSYGGEWMKNPTGLNVISNGGMRWGSDVYPDIDGLYQSYDKYTNEYQDKVMYMTAVGRITNYSTQLNAIVSTKGRTDGQPFSLFKFQSGKDVGSIELGLSPIALATEVVAPGKKVDKTTVKESQTLKYTITQTVGNMKNNYNDNDTSNDKRVNQRAKYTSLVVIDNLPAEVEYVSAVARNEYGIALNNSQCAINYDEATHTVTFTFSSSYLQNTMRYVGEAYTFEINTKVEDLDNSTVQDYIVSNSPKTVFNNSYTAEGNTTRTQVLYDIYTKGENTDIVANKGDATQVNLPSITNLIGGTSNHTVVFEPKLGYYIETVQWAKFQSTLADTTDIPSNNITISELKDGSESTYKHVATMDSSVNNGYNYDPFGTTTFTYNTIDNSHYVKVVSKEMKMVIQISKEDIETGKDIQGDAKFEGAQYTIYKTYNETTGAVSDAVEVVTLDADGNGDSSELALGTYYVKETLVPEGYLIDENVYTVTQTAEQQTADREKVSYHLVTSKEKVMKGSLEVVKSLHNDENTESDPAAGCKLFLTLDSNPEKVYEATINENGYAKFEQIPYGWYTITESEEARIAGYKLMDPEPVYIRENNIRLYRIIEENPIRTYVKVVKKDAETGRVIPVANTKYKIWSYADNAYVTMMSYQEGLISVFTTGAKGEFKTPETLPIGKYKLVELTPPAGYQSQDMDFEIKDGVFENSIENPVVVVEQKDIAQKAKIKITKVGEVLVGVKQETDPDTGLEVIIPVYEEKGLEGVKFTVTASEDIVTADGTVRMQKGESIEIVTDEEGIAQTEELYLGTYTLQETETLPGYKLNDTVETVVLDYRTNGVAEDGKTIVIPDYTVEYTYKNERIPYVLEFDKTFGNSEYNNVDKVYTENVKFGLYAAKDIKGYASENVLIKADTLLEVISVENGKCKATVELPLGEYYIQELDIEGLPFEIDTTKYGFVFKPEATANVQVITINDGNSIDNPLIKGNMNFLKITRKVYEANKDLIEEIVTNNDVDAFNELANEYGLEGAKYQVYFKDENGEYQKLQVKVPGSEEYEDVYFTTDSAGIDAKLLPYGTYYVKEVEAPAEHEVDPNYIEVKVSGATNISIVNDPKIQGKISIKHVDIDTGEEIFPVEKDEDDLGESYTTEDREKEINEEYGAGFDIYELVEEKLPENKDGIYEKEEQEIIYYYKRYTGSLLVIKKDAETAERLPGCIFTIKDKVTGKVLVENAETDENGEYYMEEVPYGLYVFTEVKAPEGYKIEEGSVGAEFAVSTDETIFEIVNTGDIAVVALSTITLVSALGIAFVIIRNKKAMD